MSETGKYNLTKVDLPESLVAVYQEEHRQRCMPKGFFLLDRDVEHKRQYGNVEFSTVRPNFYPYGVSENKYPYDENGMEITGVSFLLVIPEKNRVMEWLVRMNDYRIVARFLVKDKGYFPDLSSDEVLEVISDFVRNYMDDYEFLANPVTCNKALRAYNEFKGNIEADKVLSMHVLVQSDRIMEMRESEMLKGVNNDSITKDNEVMSRMISRLHDIQVGVKSSIAKSRLASVRKSEMEIESKNLKGQEDEGIVKRENLEQNEDRIIAGLSKIPEGMRNVLKDQESRRKILEMVKVLKSKDNVEVVEDRDLSNVVSNRILVKETQVDYEEREESRENSKDDDDDDIITI